MLSVIPGFFHLVMGLLMFKYRITDKFYNEMMHGQASRTGLSEDSVREAPVA
jgi:GPH family glycoside/pentoside/hexuronide:cation symporter